MSSDNAVKQNVHNGVCFAQCLRGRAHPDFASRWTGVVSHRGLGSGEAGVRRRCGRCYVEVNGKRNPSLEAVNSSLRWGRVGLGSFDETGDFRNIRMHRLKPAAGGDRTAVARAILARRRVATEVACTKNGTGKTVGGYRAATETRLKSRLASSARPGTGDKIAGVTRPRAGLWLGGGRGRRGSNTN